MKFIFRPLPLLLVLLTFRALFLLLFIVSGTIPLSPDEAQYWTWSQALDFGYYSKPPGIAWLISLTTLFFGHTEVGVRFSALLLGFLFPIAIFWLARSLRFSEKVAFWSALIAAFSPVGFFLSFVATTDPGSLLFATLALGTLAVGMGEGKKISFPLFGLWMLCGLLFKWNLLWIWLFVVALMPFYPELRKKGIIVAFVFTLLAFLPSLYWNFSHDFATFQHVANTVVEKKSSSNFFDFLGSQIALLTPIFFFLYLLSLKRVWQERKNRALSFVALFSMGLFLFLIASLFKKIQANWALLFFPPMMVLAAWHGWERTKWPRVWMVGGLFFSLVAMMAILAIPVIQSQGLAPHLSYTLNPFRQCMGNNKLGSILTKAGYDPRQDFLFGDKYQVASLLSFYGPEQRRAYFFNLSGSRHNQFSYWEKMDVREKNKTGYFCLIENTKEESLAWYQIHYLEVLAPYFGKVSYRGSFPLFIVNDEPVRWALLFRCEGYNGKLPQEGRVY